MKIGVNARTFSTPQPGGSVQAAKEVTRKLIDDPSLDVVLFGHRSIKKEFREVVVDDRFYTHRSRIFGVLWERTILPHLAKRHGVDVLFAPNGNGPLTKQDYVVVTWVHDIGSKSGWMDPIHQLYRNLTIPHTISLSDRVVTPSEFTKHEIIEKLKVSETKIDVIHNGIDEIFRDNQQGDTVDLPERYILFVSSSLKFGDRKNLEIVLHSYDFLRNKGITDRKLVLVGDKNERIFDESSFPEDILITGYLTDLELKYTYQNADIFLFPSVHEGFGLPPLEAMASGTPVVASNRASMPEVLNGGALLTDPTDVLKFAESIQMVLEDDHLRQELVSKGKNQVERYTWEQTKDKLVSTFTKSLHDRP